MPHVRSSVSGESASSSRASPAWKSCHAVDGLHSFPPDTVVEVKALACELPRELGLPALPPQHRRDQTGDPQPRLGRLDRRDHPVALAVSGRHPTLVPPELDLPPRPPLRGTGRADPRPLSRPLAGPAAWS